MLHSKLSPSHSVPASPFIPASYNIMSAGIAWPARLPTFTLTNGFLADTLTGIWPILFSQVQVMVHSVGLASSRSNDRSRSGTNL